MTEPTLYTIGELAELAGVTPRTIRYYTSEGLLPRPDARGQYALYGEEHLLRLKLIARLKEAYLPLGEIKAQIEHLGVEQVRALLAEEPQPAAPAPSSAADYLAQVLNRPSGLAALAESGGEYRLSLATPASPPAAAPAMRLPEPTAAQAPAAPAPAVSAPAPMQYGFAAPAEQASQPPRLLRGLLPRRREQSAPAAELAPAAEQWRRISLAPGVELHVREPLAAALRERVAQLIELARGLFDETH